MKTFLVDITVRIEADDAETAWVEVNYVAANVLAREASRIEVINVSEPFEDGYTKGETT